jgi:hypothetical protein
MVPIGLRPFNSLFLSTNLVADCFNPWQENVIPVI